MSDPRITVIKERAAFEREKEIDGDHWYDTPSKLRVLSDAVRAKAAQVELGDRKYRISYGYDFGSKVTDESEPCIKLTRVDGGFAPMGYISYKKLGLK